MLIASPRHSRADLAAWARWERVDAARAKSPALQRAEDDAAECVRRFAEDGPCYAGLSCGKDSVVLMGILRSLWRRHGIVLPVVYVRVLPHENPDNSLVLDALRGSCGDALARLDVIDVHAIRDASGAWAGTGRLEAGFALARVRYGDRYVSGIRADESRARTLRHAGHGTTTARTCAPLSAWSGADVFAYLSRENLPVHPTYACTYGGRLDRTRLRVATLGGDRGTGHGRRSHERHYYGDELDALR